MRILLKSACAGHQMHIMAMDYEEYMTQVEMLAANIMTCIVETVPLNTFLLLLLLLLFLCGHSSCLIWKQLENEMLKVKIVLPIDRCPFCEQIKIFVFTCTNTCACKCKFKNSIAHILKDSFTNKICGITEVAYNSCVLSFKNLKHKLDRQLLAIT